MRGVSIFVFIPPECLSRNANYLKPLPSVSTSTDKVSEANARLSLDLSFVTAQLNRAVAIVGSSMAVFTFILFFLYPRYAAQEIDPFLFQGTLTVMVMVIFSLGFSGFFYFGIYMSTDPAEKRVLLHRGNVMYFIGLELVTIEPAMILFTVGLYVIAFLALALFAVFASYVARQSWKLGRSVKGAPAIDV